MSGLSKWVLGAIFAVVLGICIVGAALAIATSDQDVDVNLGDDEFRLDHIGNLADDAPLQFNDIATGQRPVVIVHEGDDPEAGWSAYLALAPGSDACVVNWDPDDEVFRDCEGETYPAAGTGLRSFPARVEHGTLIVDLGRGG